MKPLLINMAQIEQRLIEIQDKRHPRDLQNRAAKIAYLERLKTRLRDQADALLQYEAVAQHIAFNHWRGNRSALADTYTYICECILSDLCAPSVSQIARHFGISIQSVYEHVDRLVEKGYLRWVYGFDTDTRQLEVVNVDLVMLRAKGR